MEWLPDGKRAAVCFSVDDIHPSTSADGYEAGGDLSNGTLGYVERLLQRHDRLKTTLFVTPDWRPVQLARSRRLARLPMLSKRIFHVDLHPKGRFRLDRYPRFARYLNDLPRCDVAPHGLHHVHRGPDLAVEFQNETYEHCLDILRESLSLFSEARVNHVMGFAPPGWNLPPMLQKALETLDFSFVASARDIHTSITPGAEASMSGLKKVPLAYPKRICDRQLVHLPVNFQATSATERAHQIISCGGLLSIKAHAFKRGGGHTLRDGLDDEYFTFLDRLFLELDSKYGDSLWWASMDEIAAHWRNARPYGQFVTESAARTNDDV